MKAGSGGWRAIIKGEDLELGEVQTLSEELQKKGVGREIDRKVTGSVLKKRS